MFLLALSLFSAATAATVEEISAAIEEFNQYAKFPFPALSQKQLNALADRELVRRLDAKGSSDSPYRVMGFLVTDVPRDHFWVACQDPDFSATPGITEKAMGFQPPDKLRWYGVMNLPTPFEDRHWVVDVSNNHAMAQATENRMWEHLWELVPDTRVVAREFVAAGNIDGVDLDRFDKAVELAGNEGAWAAIRLPDSLTLIGFYTSLNLAGNIPESLAARFGNATMKTMMFRMEERGKTVIPSHYVEPLQCHVFGGDGSRMGGFNGD